MGSFKGSFKGSCKGLGFGSWRFMGSGYKWEFISRVTIVITHIRGLITPFYNYP